jgi:hypothetical protein
MAYGGDYGCGGGGGGTWGGGGGGLGFGCTVTDANGKDVHVDLAPGGGGGGSSSATTSATYTAGVQAGDGKVTFTYGVPSYSLSPSNPIISPGATQQLTILQDGVRKADQTATWSSSNSAIAKVSSTGLVTGVSDGSATITATFTGGTAKTTVTVCRVGYC